MQWKFWQKKAEDEDKVIDVLRHLNKFMATSGDYRQKNDLWDILTALRGPDNTVMESYSAIKAATTAVIRWHVFGWNVAGNTQPDSAVSVAVRKTICVDRENHFGLHAYNAFKALGLKWDELNPNPHE